MRTKTFNRDLMDKEDWGTGYEKPAKISVNALCFVWFVFGVAVATIALHFTIISPLLNSCI